jgi:type I restriction enzyme, R subunit
LIRPNERFFEDAISQHLVELGGYRACKWGTKSDWAGDFDVGKGIDSSELFVFIDETQTKAWAQLVKLHGGNPDSARKRFLDRLASELDDRGTVDVLRHGVMDQNVEIRLAFFKPAHGLTPELEQRYLRNRLTVTRQLPYETSSNKTLDVCLFINGIPVATAELKNELTGQGIDNAINQYRTDRDPRNVTLARRAVVHFAVDPLRVAMTTRLSGASTRFLPFNIGNDGGAGNPPSAHGHRTAYLWEQVWSRDPWMDILGRFIHIERPAKGSQAQRKAAEVVIFPRYHQWDAVLKLERSARKDGPGHNYLVEHSAGSGKSNTIAWTAHRLASLHDDLDQKIFDKVVVITDRVILDRQLQDTIYQFEHARGVVEKIDENSQQLAQALAGEQAKIIITTLQKFPFVLDNVAALPNRRYAVIVDEAHSSQTGEAAKDLKLVLGAPEEQELTAAEAEDMGLVTSAEDLVQEALAKAAGARAGQDNLSFFAFTATPKQRTLELFGTKNADGKYEPFHLYSMRQAIEEGFILDVLANYTTYHSYWRIEKKIREDPVYQENKAQRAIARFVSLHPHNLAQRAEIIVEHFRAHTMAKIGGSAKAMVVTSSRLHAVRYKQAIDKYINEKGYSDLKTLVAFSGKVGDFSEPGMNKFPESQTAQKFARPEYQVLIVAEKFQTGFDQPLLHTMYVDKVLVGLAAVQTLSRLNRIHPLKSDTFVLDFRNDAEDIQKAFEPYYGKTVGAPTDPNVLWDTRARIDGFDVLRADEMQGAVTALLSSDGQKAHGALYALLDPALERYRMLDDEVALEFKDALDKFVRTYSFVSQIVSFQNTGLERDYIYCRALAAYIRNSATVERLDLGTEVELTHLRTEMTFEGSLALKSQTGEVKGIAAGKGKLHEPEMEKLSKIVQVLNERFGLDLGEADQLLFDQFEESWAADQELADQAKNNSIENFKLVFDPKFINTIVTRMDANQSIFKQVLDDQEFQDILKDFYVRKMYSRLRRPATEASPPAAS